MNDCDELANLLGADADSRGGKAPVFHLRSLHPQQARAIADYILESDWLRNRDVQKWKEGRASGFNDWGDMWADDAPPTEHQIGDQQ